MKSTINRVDADEVKLAEIVKHPIGIIIVFLETAVGLIAGLLLSYFLIPSVLSDTDAAFMIANIFASAVVGVAIIILIIATIIYRQNRFVITDRNITQTLQYGLFSRKVSQLNLANVEDVTAKQDGVLSTLFDFGALNVETAGEQVNFSFTNCPRPGYYAKIILEAREKMLGQHDNELRPEPNITD